MRPSGAFLHFFLVFKNRHSYHGAIADFSLSVLHDGGQTQFSGSEPLFPVDVIVLTLPSDGQLGKKEKEKKNN